MNKKREAKRDEGTSGQKKGVFGTQQPASFKYNMLTKKKKQGKKNEILSTSIINEDALRGVTPVLKTLNGKTKDYKLGEQLRERKSLEGVFPV